MPYIPLKERDYIDVPLRELFLFVKTKGQYNYVITRLMHQFILKYNAEFDGSQKVSLCYDSCSDALGILESIKASLIETVILPYEKQKIKQNGNISILDVAYLNDSKEK